MCIADEDRLLAVRLQDVLDWYVSTSSGALSRHAPGSRPPLRPGPNGWPGLYQTLDYRLAS